MDDTIISEITNSIKALYELTARIDERVKMLIEKYNQSENRMNSVITDYNNIRTKVSILEQRDSDGNSKKILEELRLLELKTVAFETDINAKISAVQQSTSSHENKWRTITNYVFQSIWIVLICWALYSLGLGTPPLTP